MRQPVEDLPGAYDVHVWQVRLDSAIRRPGPSTEPQRLAAVARQRLAAQAAVRSILARYLTCTPDEVPIVRDPWGRPRLRHGELDYSWSRRGFLGLLAIARQRVGIDIEVVAAANLDAASVACSAGERAVLAQAAGAAAWFAQAWSAKEACVKADGRGLHCDPAEVVTLAPGPRLRTGVSLGRHQTWHLQALPAPEGHKAALASAWPACVVRRALA